MMLCKEEVQSFSFQKNTSTSDGRAQNVSENVAEPRSEYVLHQKTVFFVQKCPLSFGRIYEYPQNMSLRVIEYYHTEYVLHKEFHDWRSSEEFGGK